jgi:hypothetical protein
VGSHGGEDMSAAAQWCMGAEVRQLEEKVVARQRKERSCGSRLGLAVVAHGRKERGAVIERRESGAGPMR